MGTTVHQDTPPWVRSRELDALTRSFRAADAALLQSRALLKRTDTKYVIPVRRLLDLLDQVRGGYAVLYTGDTTRPDYHTLYYDTPDLAMFRAHHRGQRPRHKLRVRHHVTRGRSYLEQKCKDAHDRTIKHRQERAFGDNTLQGAQGLPMLEAAGPRPLLRPTAWTNFQRITLVGLRQVERATIDLNLTLRADQDTTALPELAIVEIKQPRVDRTSPIWSALRGFGLRPFSISKYCTAICLLRPEVRHNRFKKKLKHIERLRSS
jgi:hypothetical protein